MRENRKSGSMSEDGKRSDGTMEERQRPARGEATTRGPWPPRPSSTLPSYLVIGLNADKTKNGGVVMAYGYSAIVLTNTTGVVELWWGKTLVDRVAYTSGANGWQKFATGQTQQLSSDKLSAIANDDGSNWCKSTVTFGAGDKGTPGTVNAVCPPDKDSDEVPDATDNCPNLANTNQSDSDKDGYPRVADAGSFLSLMVESSAVQRPSAQVDVSSALLSRQGRVAQDVSRLIPPIPSDHPHNLMM